MSTSFDIAARGQPDNPRLECQGRPRCGGAVPIKIVVADDHPIVLQGLRHLFERQADFLVAACCVDADTAIDAVRAHQPDVVILDLRMPGRSGLDALRYLADQKLECRAVLLTAAITQ